MSAILLVQRSNLLGQLTQVRRPKQRSTSCNLYEWIRAHEVRPGGRQSNESLSLIVEKDSILAPGTAMDNQLKLSS